MIYAECNSETILILSSNISKKKMRHLGGKTSVLKRLEKHNGCTGLIDEDPFSSQPPMLKKYELMEDYKNLGIKVLQNNKKANRLLVLCPRVEEWILKASKGTEINLIKDYDLPTNPDDLHEIIPLNEEKCMSLVKDLLRKRNKRLKKLSKLLSMKNRAS